MKIKTIFEKLTGIDKIKEQAAADAAEALQIAREAAESAKEAQRLAAEAEEARKQAEKEEAFAKLSPKDRATQRNQPWVAVLDTHVNKENIRNGFFELDWNEYFIAELIYNGYGTENDPEEEIVDRWFKDLARNILSEEGQDPTRGAGFINVNKIGGGKAAVE